MDSVKNCFILVSILPTPDGTKRLIRIRNYIISVGVLTTLLFILISSGVFFFKNLHGDLEKSLHALTTIGAFSCTIYTIGNGFNQRHAIGKVFSQFEKIRNECEFFRFIFHQTIFHHFIQN